MELFYVQHWKRVEKGILDKSVTFYRKLTLHFTLNAPSPQRDMVVAASFMRTYKYNKKI